MISPITITDIQAIALLQPDDWEDIMPKVYTYIKSEHCYPIKLTLERSVVGMGALTVHEDVAWLGHIIVHKSHRGNGLGKYITAHLVEDAKQHGCTTIHLIATDLGAYVYSKLGFLMETEYVFYKEIELGTNFAVSSDIQPYNSSHLESILKLDMEVSRENRWRTLGTYIESAYVFINNEFLQGYYIPTLGEGLIIASTPSAGLELLKLHLKSTNRLSLPKDTTVVLDFLNRLGHTPFKTAKRMSVGVKHSVKYDQIYNRIGGNIG